MSSSPVYGFNLVEDVDDIDDIGGLINSGIQSVEDNLPVRYVSSMAELDALTGTTHPNGQIAHLTTDSGSVKAGSRFIRAGGKWLFAGGYVTDLSTFLTGLTSNIGTFPSAVVIDQASASSRIFTTTGGTNSMIQEVGSSDWIAISHIPGYQDIPGYAPFAYRAVPGGAQLRGGMQKTGGTPISSAAGTQVGQLPGGARPTYTGSAQPVGIGDTQAIVTFGTDGRILVQALSIRTTNYLNFDGITIPQGA